MTSCRADMPNFLEFWVKMAKMTLKVKVNDPYCFGANLLIPAQICDELSCGQGKVYGRTDGRTDRQTERRRQRQYPFGLKGQLVHEPVGLIGTILGE